MQKQARFNKLAAWLLTLAMLITLIPSFTHGVSAADTHIIFLNNPFPDSGKITADKETAAAGETVTLTVDPNEGFELGSLSAYSSDYLYYEILTPQDNGTCTFTMPEKDVIVDCSFTHKFYTITVDSGITNGKVTVNGSDTQSKHYQQEFSITVTPDTGYVIDTVTMTTDGGTTVEHSYAGNDTYYYVMPADNVTVTATFKASTYYVGFNVINATFNGAATATAGTDYIAKLTADTGYALPETLNVLINTLGITAGTDYTYDSSTGNLTIYGSKITGNIGIHGQAVPNAYTVTLNTTTNGTVTADKTTAAEGDKITLTIAPATDYVLNTLTVDGTNVTADVTDGEYTFTMPAGNVTVTATFKAHTHNFDTDGNCVCGAKCDHSDSTHDDFTDIGNTTHSYTCTVCGGTVTVSHTGMEVNECSVCGFVQYDIWVGNIRVTSLNIDDVLGDDSTGSIQYDPDTNTLTVDGDVTISTSYHDRTNSYGIYAKGGLVITGDADSTLTVGGDTVTYGVYVDSETDALEVNGGMTLNATGSDAGIQANTVGVGTNDPASVPNDTSKIYATGGSYGIRASSVYIYDANLITATGNAGIAAIDADSGPDFYLGSGGHLIVNGTSGALSLGDSQSLDFGMDRGQTAFWRFDEGDSFESSDENGAFADLGFELFYGTMPSYLEIIASNDMTYADGKMTCSHGVSIDAAAMLEYTESSKSYTLYFSDPEPAINSANNFGPSITNVQLTLLGNVEVTDAPLTVTDDLLLNLAGFTINGSIDGALLEVATNENANTTGALTITDSSTGKTGSISNTGEGGIGVQVSAGTLTIEGGKITGTKAGIYLANGVNPITVASADISGSTVDMATPGLFATAETGITLTADMFTSADTNYGVVLESSSLHLKPDLSAATVTFSPESATYTRYAQFPTVTVTWNGQALTDGSDYYVTWTDEKGATVTEVKNAGTYTATIYGVQGYIGEVTKTFTINKATPVITWENESWMIVYTGSAAKIVAVLTLQEGEKGELTYSYYNNDNPGVSGNGLPSQVGDYTITASYAATDNYEAAQATTHLKIDPADISGAEVTVSGTYAYTGNAQTPAPVVELYGNTLKMDADYTVSYTNNTNAGTANVTVTGKGNYMGEATGTFTINQKQTTVTAPVNQTLDIIPSEVSDVTALLPSTVATDDGNFTITWSCDSLDTTPNGTSTFKWTITDEKFSNYTADKTSDTIIVTNGNAIAVNHTGTDKDTTYGKNTYDVSQMFTIDENAGTASYSATGITGAGTISGSALTITKAGTIEIKLTTEAKGNYAAGEATATLTVAKGTGEGTVTMDGWTYGGTASNPVAESESNGTGNVSYLYKVKDAADSTYTDSKPTNAGNYTVKATFAGTDLYNEVVKTADFTIAKAQAVITVDTTPIVKTYGDTWELPTATSTFGAPVADKKVSEMVDAGTYTVTYSVKEADNWLGAEKTISVTINPKKIEKPAADPTEFVYDGKEKTYSVVASDYYTVTGNKMTDAGSQNVIVALKDKENYTWNNGETTDEKFTFSIAPKPITGATVGAFAELTYTGEAQIPDATVTIDGLTATGTWSKVTNVADKTTFTADGNFTGTIADKETGMTAADMSAGITASGYNGTYDGEGHTITVSLSGVAEGATVKYGTTEGTYDLDATPSYTDSGSTTVYYQVTKTNYETVTGSATVEIAKKKIDSAIVLTAPVKNAAPQTEITGTGYAATVVWSPEVTDKFGYNTEYTATVTITTDGNHTVEGVAANGYTVEGAKTVTNEENSNVITIAYEKTGSRPSSGGGSSSNTTTTTTKNDDGSTTKTTTNKTTGTTTETTTYPDGSTTTVETKKDGTVTTTEKDKDGNTTTTVENPDGSSTTTEKNKDGSKTVVEKEADGTTTTTEKDSDGNKTVTTEKADGTTTTEETKKDGTTVKTETTASGETTAEVEAKGETEVVIPVPDTEKVQMVVITDEDGNNTYITEIETTDNGVAVTTNGNASVSVKSGEKKEFVDVHPVDHWSEKSVDFVHILGLMNGTSATHFSPDVHLTRAMLVTVLYRADGEPEIANDESFADVEGGSYYEKAVAWAKANGIVNGTSATTFEPNTNITREQIAAIMHRYADFKGHDVSVGENTNILSYTDVHHVSEYAIGSMQYAVGSGLIKGKTETTLNSLDNATRAEAAAILERFIKAN